MDPGSGQLHTRRYVELDVESRRHLYVALAMWMAFGTELKVYGLLFVRADILNPLK